MKNTDKLSKNNKISSAIEPKEITEDDQLFIETEPPANRLRINRVKNSEESEEGNLMEHYPKRRITKLARRYASELDEDYKESSSRMALVHFLEPQRVDEEFDINVDGIYYRVSINSLSNEVWCNEIVSYNYDGKGMVLLKNPRIDLESIEKLNNIFEGIPKDKKINSLKSFYNQQLKKIAEQNTKSKTKRKVGRRREEYIIKATAKAIRRHNYATDTKRETVKKIYVSYQSVAHSEISFIRSVLNLWDEIDNNYESEKKSEKTILSRKKYAQKFLKNLEKPRKQRAKKVKDGKN